MATSSCKWIYFFFLKQVGVKQSSLLLSCSWSYSNEGNLSFLVFFLVFDVNKQHHHYHGPLQTWGSLNSSLFYFSLVIEIGKGGIKLPTIAMLLVDK